MGSTPYQKIECSADRIYLDRIEIIAVVGTGLSVTSWWSWSTSIRLLDLARLCYSLYNATVIRYCYTIELQLIILAYKDPV